MSVHNWNSEKAKQNNKKNNQIVWSYKEKDQDWDGCVDLD